MQVVDGQPASRAHPVPPDPRIPRCSPAAFLAVWRELEAAVAAGLVRSIGCSNMTARKLDALLRGDAASGTPACAVRPVALQVELHPVLAQGTFKAFCDAEGIVMQGYHPLGSPSRPAQYRTDGDPDVLGSPAVLAVAAETGKSPAQVRSRKGDRGRVCA